MELLLDLSLIKKGDTVAVALSGGKDSVALLYALFGLAKERGFTLKAVHVEHGIRGEASLLDEGFVREICSVLNVPLRVVKVDVPASTSEYGSVEQTARELRYRAFDHVVKDGFCDKIATAHHAGDNAETVLMRALRGTGVTGLSGIKRERGFIIRPMLGVPSEAVTEYVKARGIMHVTDETNSSSEYTRNFLRNEVLPVIKTRFPSAEESLARLARIAGEVDEYVREQAMRLVTRDGDSVKIAESDEPVLIKRAVKLGAEMLGVFADVEERHLDIAVTAMRGDKKTYDLPWGIVLEREQGGLSMGFRPEPVPEVSAVLGRNVVGDKVVTIQEIPERVNGELCFSTELNGLVLRGRREGDSFQRYGGGRKSLGDYLTDTKVPLRVRDRLIVLARDNDVLAVVGVEIADSVKVTQSSRKIYKITEEKYEE